MSSNVRGELTDFMDAGYKGFGLYGANADGSCACGYPECKAAYKHPRNSAWQVTPDWSDEQMDGFEVCGHYDTGYGVLVSGLLVVDVDARNGGVESYAKLCADVGLDLHINCGLAVGTGSGGGSMHLYYKAPPGLSLVQTHKAYPGIDFKSSGFCVGPGSLHASGNRYTVLNGRPADIDVAPEDLVKLLVRPDAYRASHDGTQVDVTDSDLRNMLTYISPNCERATWISIGMALHHTTSGAGFELWDSWSQPGDTYPGAGNLRNQWDRFGKAGNPVTFGSIFYHAEQGGWEPASAEDETMPEFAPGTWMAALAAGDAHKKVDLEVEEEVATKDNKIAKISTRHPFDISDVDLLRPPGFVGELCTWVNAQSRFPRESLSVGAAIQAVGNIAGLRYSDEYGVTTNLFMINVADSATGKEAILQALNDVHRHAGISRAVVGSIKSEQEIIRNLLDNQAAFYLIDEFGIVLKTISTSKEAYHAGVVGALMNAYSKANSFMPLSGDVKRDVRKTLSTDLASNRKKLDENEGDPAKLERRIASLERALKSIDNGLEAPFLALSGFTTPITFESLVTYEQATNGFIGRSIIIQEKDSNPRLKKGYRATPMTDRMQLTLMGMYDGGYYDADSYRIEHYGDREKIPTTAGARMMLEEVSEWAWELADRHRHTTGLESIPRRAYEMVLKISLILAAPGRIRTEEHVRWAYAFVARDIRMKCALANANRMEQIYNASKDEDSGLKSMTVKLLSRLEGDEWETMGQLRNKIARGKESLFMMAISDLESKGKIIVETYTAGHNGKEAKRIRLSEAAE